MNITWDNQSAKDDETIDALAALYNYQPLISDAQGQLIPNPMTKKQFATKRIKNWLRELRHAVVANSHDLAKSAAMAQLKESDPEE